MRFAVSRASAVLLLLLAACGAAQQRPVVPGDLLTAVIAGDAARVRALLDAGAGVDTQNDAGDSALILAVLYADPDVTKLLLARGADVRHRNGAGVTALHEAVDRVDVMAALVAAGADVDAATAQGYTPLMTAAVRDDDGPAVEFLLAHGADAKVTTPNGMSATILAAAGDPAALTAILDHGGDARTATRSGFSALHAAARLGDATNVRLLLARSADPAALDGQKRSALMWAAQMGARDGVIALLAAGASPDGREAFSGTSALIQAAASDRGADLVPLLLRAHADPHLVDNEGLTAAAWAQRRGDGGPVGDGVSARAALLRAIPVLEGAGPAFTQASGCHSCHHNVLPALALARIGAAGFPVDDVARVTAARLLVESQRSLRASFLVGTGFADVVEPSYFLPGIAAAGYPRDDMTDAMVRYLVLRQTRAGSWHAQMQRIPLDGSDVSFTAMAVRSLRLYGPPSRAADTGARIARARAWLAAAPASTNEDLTFKALGLLWAGAAHADIAATAARLAARQRPDGGFAQRDGMASDAYATGQAVFALLDAGKMARTDPVIQGAVDYLVTHQFADGSWFVATRALPFQPFFQSGFPHGRSQYSSAQGTSWAALALAASL